MKRKVLAGLMICTLMLTMLTGFSSASAGKAVKDSITIGVSADMGTLDPLHTISNVDFNICNSIFNRLVKYDNSDNIVPDLAQSWKISPDKLSYTITLKKGIKFHNGEELKASDVVFTFNSAKSSPYLASRLMAVKGITAVDNYTVKFDLSYPYAPFLSSIYDIYIVNQKAFTASGDKVGENPVGTGPYKFVKHTVGQSVTLTRFDGYFGGSAPIKNVVYKVITDPDTTYIALETGDVDFSNNVPTIAIKNADSAPGLAVNKFDTRSLIFILFNTKVKPFDNVLVRQAISYAVDKPSIINISAEGMGTPSSSILNKLTFGYSKNVKGYDYNIKKAKELLTKAGYPKGFEVKFKTLGGVLGKGSEVIQANLAQIGIKLNIEMCEQNAYIKDVMTGNYGVGILQIALGADADSWEPVFSSKGGMNLCKYKNTNVDQIFMMAKKITDPQARIVQYEKLAKILNNDAPFVPLYHVSLGYVLNKNLKMGHIDPSGTYYVNQLSWTK